jgi:hypothetical protein
MIAPQGGLACLTICGLGFTHVVIVNFRSSCRYVRGQWKGTAARSA